MQDLTELANDLDRDPGACLAIIETPNGRRSKYDYIRRDHRGDRRQADHLRTLGD
jgi:hypothetical protein